MQKAVLVPTCASLTSSETVTQPPWEIMWKSSGGPRKSPAALDFSSPASSCGSLCGPLDVRFDRGRWFVVQRGVGERKLCGENSSAPMGSKI